MSFPLGIPTPEDVAGFDRLGITAVLIFVLLVLIVVGCVMLRVVTKWGRTLWASLERQTDAFVKSAEATSRLQAESAIRAAETTTRHADAIIGLHNVVRDWHNRLSGLTMCRNKECPVALVAPPLEHWSTTPKPGTLTTEGLREAREAHKKGE